jgi:hypothetical protein
MIRLYNSGDLGAFKAIHESSGFDYIMPDLDDPLFIYRGTVEEDGKPVQGLLVKLQGEVYLYIDHSWGTPEQRWKRFVELTDEAKRAAWENGLDSLVCVVPPEIAASFGKRLEQIGMVEDRPWPKFSFDLRGYAPQIRGEIEVEAT